MKIVHQEFDILTPISTYGVYELEEIEKIARVCYKSEDKILDQAESARQLISSLIKKGHEAMLEHSILSVKFICDRGVSHELVRHRMASFAQESTRYCNYSSEKFGGEITVIDPELPITQAQYDIWNDLCLRAEQAYMELVDSGVKPQVARAVLPNSLKTEVVVTANYREWRHILKLRTAPDAQPQMRRLMLELLYNLHELIPVIFDDIYEERFLPWDFS